MKRAQIVYTETFKPSPVSYWVHRNLDGEGWVRGTQFDPPLPKPVPGRGWARLLVELDGVFLDFSSMAELRHVIEVLRRNPMPSTIELSAARGPAAAGPNGHWLSRLPAKAKSAKFRRKLVEYLETVGEGLLSGTGRGP